MTDDASEFLRGARKVPGDVDEGDDGDVEGVAVADVPARLVRRVDVEAARKVVRLVGDDADDFPSYPGVAGEDVLGPQGLHFEELPSVHDPTDDFPDVVPLVGVDGDDVPQLHVLAQRIVSALHRGRVFEVVLRQVAQELPDLRETLLFALRAEVRVPAPAVVRHGPAYLLAGDFFSGDGLDDGRTGDVHDTRPFDHEDVVGERGAVHGASGGGTRYDGDLRHHSARHGVPEKDLAVAVERVDGLLDPRSAAVVDTHHGTARAHGHVHDLADLRRVHLAQRTTEHGEVLAVDAHFPTVHQSPSDDDSVSVVHRLLQSEVHAPVTHELVHLDEGPRVQQPPDALPRRSLTLLPLLGDRLLSASEHRLLTLPEQLLA